MILSIHIPKTAGRTFLAYLRRAFGSKLLVDYGDIPELVRPENVERRRTRRAMIAAQAQAIEREFDIIHGHYQPTYYLGLFAETRCLTFVRDPYQHAMSAYFQVARTSWPGSEAFRSMDVAEFVKALSNHQSIYISGLTIQDFSLVGITEHFDRSMLLFQKIFKVPLTWSGDRHNVNPNRPAADYEISDDLRRAVVKYRAQDIELYRKASERFAELARGHDV